MTIKGKLQRWWEVGPEQVHEALFKLSEHLEADQSGRRQDNALLRALYGAKGYDVSTSGDLIPNFSINGQGEPVWRYNLIRSVVGVLEARILLGRPKATFVTNGGGWSQQRRAKRADRFVYGVMHQSGFYSGKILRKSWRDSLVTDLGVVKGWVEDGRIRLVRVDPDEIKVDMADGYYGDPQSLLHTYIVSRDQAHAWVEAWHEEESEEVRARLHGAVDAAAAATDSSRGSRRLTTFGDVIEVQEAWHLPSSPRAEDGKHALAINTATLLEEECDFFPFAFFRADEPWNGFYAQGLAEQAVPHQRSINATLRRISKILHYMATSRWWVDQNTKIATEHIATNESATVLRGGTRPPSVLAPAVVPPELWKWADYAIMRGLEQFGINEGAVAARKPAGVDSGKALREYNDIQSSRHAALHFAYEEGILDTARLVVRLARQAQEQGEKLTAYYPMGRRSQAVDWSEVAVDEDSFTLQMFSTASLPTTPAARKQYVDEQFSAGLIGPDDYRQLLDMPDQDASDDLRLAARDVVEQALEKMLDGDSDEGAEEDYAPPEPFDDLAFAQRRGMQVYQKAKADGAPEARLALVRRYVLQAGELAARAQPPAPPASSAPPGVPPAAPMPGAA